MYALNLAATHTISGSKYVLGYVDPAVYCYSLCANLKEENNSIAHSLYKWFISSKMTKLQMCASLPGRLQRSMWVEGTGLRKGNCC